MNAATSSPRLTVLQGDALAMLRTLPAGSVHCFVTSPPYYGVRDYKADGQIGLEETVEQYIARIVEVFREARRVLHPQGTLWLNLGDSYANSGLSGGTKVYEEKGQLSFRGARGEGRVTAPGLKPKDLIGVPWRVALALQAGFSACDQCGKELRADLWPRWNGHVICPDCPRSKVIQTENGWWLRSDIIWHKKNPMPGSQRDRPTTAHEYLFLLTKSARYFYDEEAIAEPVSGTAHARGSGVNPKTARASRAVREKQNASFSGAVSGLVSKRKKRSVWSIASEPFKEAHFATFPRKLVLPCVLAGTSEVGCCPKCLAPWARVVAKVDTGVRQKAPDGWDTGEGGHGTVHRAGRQKGETEVPVLTTRTVGWRMTCKCAYAAPIPCTVADMFGGSGTVGEVALSQRRHAVLIELAEHYLPLIERRCGGFLL